MPLYGLLKRTHADYDGELYAELEDLYEGGYQIAKNAKKYLPRLANEHVDMHGDRCKSASYMPYMGQIVDQLTAWLFTDELTVQAAPDAENPDTPGELPDVDFYGAFASDADLTGVSFSDMVQRIAPMALLKRRALVGVDFPKIQDDVLRDLASLADEDKLGAGRAYLYSIPIEQLINWDRHTDGTFKWVILNRITQPQAGPLEPADTIVEEFKVWTLSPLGKAHWDVFRIAYDPKKVPKDKTEVPLVESGETIFAHIPIVEIELSKGLWVGNKIGTMVKEHFQRRSTLIASELRSLYEIPVVKFGPEIGAAQGEIPSVIQQNPGRGMDPVEQFMRKGFVPIGAGDDLKFVGPSGAAYAIVDSELADLKDEIFRVVHLMAASVSNNKSAALGRSGLAKQQDKLDTAIVLTAIGSDLRRFALRVYGLISAARSEDVVWHAKGLDDYESEDRELLLEEAMQVDAINIPSPTFKTAYKTALAFKLQPNMPPETQETVRDEIKDGVQHEDDIHQLTQEASKDALENPPLPAPPTPPGMMAPKTNGRPPQAKAAT